MLNVILKYHWWTEDDDNIMEASFKITNPTPYAFKDFEITCNHFAPSGTKIDSNTRTIYQTIKPKSMRTIANFNMGFINTQAARSSCQITDLVPLSGE